MRQPYSGGGGGGGFPLGGSLSTVVRMLIAWNVIIFLVQQLSLRFFPSFYIVLMDYFALAPRDLWHGQFWQLGTYMFLHGSLLHIGFNMLVLWMFGGELESLWGSRRFLSYYLFTGIGAGITNALFQPSSPIPTIGASGAIYGLLLAFAMYYPNRQILLWFLFPIRSKYFVIILGAIAFFSSIMPGRDGIAHLAHLGGLVFGFLYLKDIPMKWFRGGGRRGRRGGPKVYDIRNYWDQKDKDRDSKWR